MDAPLEQFWEDLDSGEMHIRDRWQFALKSQFFPSDLPHHRYVQEFYLFIPNSLQINKNTYSKGQFYLDETNLIRYKTPEFTFEELFDTQDQRSPLTRVLSLCSDTDTPQHREELSDELKLLANVVRSTLRREVKLLNFALDVNKLDATDRSIKSVEFVEDAKKLCKNIKFFQQTYAKAQQTYLSHWKDPLFYRQLLYIEEFINDTISHYLSGLLENIEKEIPSVDFSEIKSELIDLLIEEQEVNDVFSSFENQTQGQGKVDTAEAENVVYRRSLLNKFVLDALHLATNRFSLDQQYQHWIGALSAGIATLLYFTLFVSLGNVFVINSQPFILLAVVIYVLKDRIKEWLRTLSYQQASRWFSDYITIIKSPENKKNIGVLKESLSFIDQPQLPLEIKEVRNAAFHTILETFQRPESVLFYKRIIEINHLPSYIDNRRQGLNIIFRFNIHRFLRKASDPFETRFIINPSVRKLLKLRFPKVYHLNLIIRNTSFQQDQSIKVELKKFRIVIDKRGIKRLEQISKT